ncbi:MAG: Ig-like domain-containing protein, partial [Planctomycetota bacterium]
IDAGDQSRVFNFPVPTGDLTLDNLTITGGSSAQGGGVFFDSSGTLTVNNSFIIGNNTTGSGGGIALDDGNLVLSDSIVGDNIAGSFGGGISVFDGNTSINRSSIVDNTSGLLGGGLQISTGIATITDSTVSRNSSAGRGGGIRLTAASLDLINSTISENSAGAVLGAGGGGISAGAEPVRIINSTIAGNTTVAGQGGGVDVFSAPLTIENSIVADNTAGDVSSDVQRTQTETPLTINHSLIGNADGLGTINGNVGNLTGTEANPLDPLLGELADNGGPTLTHSLLPGSPAIDAGDNALAVNADGDPLVFDQRGADFGRILAGTVDMGAFEFVDVVAPTVETIVINNGDAQRSDVTEIDVNFSEIVNVDAFDFLLENIDSATSVTPTVATETVNKRTIATLTFNDGDSLENGNYRLTVLDSVTDLSGNSLDGDSDGIAGGNAVDEFFRLFGDNDGDGDVDTDDFSFPAIERFEVAPLNEGVAVTDDAVGVGFLLFSEESLFQRFADAPPLQSSSVRNSNHIIAVRNDGVTWQYNDNRNNLQEAWIDFEPVESDRLLAEVDFDTVNSLEGLDGVELGIGLGFANGDLAFAANRFNGGVNVGEFEVTGTFFEVIGEADIEVRSVGALNSGIAAGDANTGEGFLMFSVENLFNRFASAPPLNAGALVNSDHLIAVRNVNGQWQYDNNYEFIDFTPTFGDRLLASIDFDNDTITSLEGSEGEIEGIESGFLTGDLEFLANQFNGLPNNGEFAVTGTLFVATASEGLTTPISIGQLNSGIAAGDNNIGEGFLMFSPVNLFTRFASAPPLNVGGLVNSAQLIAVRNVNGQWQYDNNSRFIDFTPIDGDRLLASIDFNNDTITSLKGSEGNLAGIDSGFLSGDLQFFSNRFNGAVNNGEFEVTGTFFVVSGESQPTQLFNVGALNSGIAAGDANTGEGFLMFSVESLFSRFASAPPLNVGNLVNSDHLIAVRIVNGQWQYDNNSEFIDFSPVFSDRLLASIDFANDTITSLQGMEGNIGGINSGFLSGDLEFLANRFNGLPNNGEFAVTGTFFVATASEGPATEIAIGALNSGIAASDNNTGEGFLMFSPVNLFTRFASAPPLNSTNLVNADQLIAVRNVGGQWQYDNNSEFIDFTPIEGDRILARIDFDNDTITSLEGIEGNIAGIDSGFLSGDLEFFANRFNGSVNTGEFEVTGTFFAVADQTE